MHDVFISYSSKDTEQAYAIRAYLTKKGISCWMAPESIPYGSNYTKEIPVGIQNCQVFLLLLSKNSTKSLWVLKELDSAVSSRKYVIPFLLDNCTPTDEFKFLLSGTHWCSAGSPNALVNLSDRIFAITKKKAPVVTPPRPQPQPDGKVGGYSSTPKKKSWWPVAVLVLALLLLVGGGIYLHSQNTAKEQQAAYRAAESLLDSRDYSGALDAFQALGDYQDSAVRVKELEQLQKDYDAALQLLDKQKFADARTAFQLLGDYRDSKDYLRYQIPYAEACYLMASAADAADRNAVSLYENAADSFSALGEYSDSAELASECLLNAALIQLGMEDYDAATAYLDRLNEADAATLRGRYAETCADEAFLLDIKEALQIWYDYEKEYSLSKEIELAWALVEPYENTHFNDPNLAALLEDFRVALETMESSLNDDGSVDPVSQYYLGEYYLFKLADTLYSDYQVFADDLKLLRDFVGKSDYYYERYTAYHTLEVSFDAWWEGDPSAHPGEDGRYYTSYTNDTDYSFDLYATISFYDADNNLLEVSEEITVHVDKGVTVSIPTIPTSVSDEEWERWKMEWAFGNVSD